MNNETRHEIKMGIIGMIIGTILVLQPIWFLKLIGIPTLLFSLYRIWTCIEITEEKNYATNNQKL